MNRNIPESGSSIDKPVWSIRLVDGPLSWSTWPITMQPLLVGRSIGCHICIDDPAVSRVQCEIMLKDESPFILHRSQNNPTLLNGSPCIEAQLKLGDIIEFAGKRMIVDLQSHESPKRLKKHETPPTTQRFDESVFLKQDSLLSNDDSVSSFASDLLALFSLQRSLARCDTPEAMRDEIALHFTNRFGATTTWMAWRVGNTTELAFVPPLSKAEQNHAPTALLRQAITTGEGIHLIEPDESNRAFLAVPLRVFNRTLGSIALQRDAALGSFTRLNLHYLLAVADGISPLIAKAEQLEQMRRDLDSVRTQSPALLALIGESTAMLEVRDNLAKAALGLGSVMLLGETGTGKELAASMLHDLSPRASAPFVTVNCAAIPEDLFESECFGHERGAFSGASQQRKGLFEQAHGGTLFLDEVGDLSPSNQSRLLRAVETKAFRRVGAEKEISVDVRIVCATNRNLRDTGESRFRDDLFYRLSTFLIWIPPLRDRIEDLADIARHFLAIYSPHSPSRPVEFTDDAMNLLRSYSWPGNVRELRNVVEQSCYHVKGSQIRASDLSIRTTEATSTQTIASPKLDEVERRHMLEILRANESNVAKSAEVLGIAASTLYYKLRKHGISLRNPG